MEDERVTFCPILNNKCVMTDYYSHFYCVFYVEGEGCCIPIVLKKIASQNASQSINRNGLIQTPTEGG